MFFFRVRTRWWEELSPLGAPLAAARCEGSRLSPAAALPALTKPWPCWGLWRVNWHWGLRINGCSEHAFPGLIGKWSGRGREGSWRNCWGRWELPNSFSALSAAVSQLLESGLDIQGYCLVKDETPALKGYLTPPTKLLSLKGQGWVEQSGLSTKCSHLRPFAYLTEWNTNYKN